VGTLSSALGVASLTVVIRTASAARSRHERHLWVIGSVDAVAGDGTPLWRAIGR
jgi:hypothetical protein